ncbi:MAG: Rz1-like lysis system protein LysC [Vogesella sp.]|uniref:Rz1-like lysis system protein LysC n=1 Tax=Vogesella sp. TaxID=1904252 RepID=UPI00391D9508
MNNPTRRAGVIPLCLLLCSACSTAPTVPELPPPLPLQILQCAPVTPCQLPTPQYRNNRQLAQTLLATQAALASCAAQIDTVAACQNRTASNANEQTF